MSELFSIKDADAGYGSGLIFRELNILITRGEFVSFIGPNGAGKSTLIRLLTGTLSPLNGKVSFCGKEINRYSTRDLAAGFSLVTRITGEVPGFSVRKFLEFGLFPVNRFRGVYSADHEKRVEEMAELTGIVHLLKRSINELSSGEFQLVQVAKALVQNSSVILLDEPVSNLDYRHSTMVMDILKNLNMSGTTVLCALHDVNSASNYSTRIVCVKNGRLLFDGNPSAVVNGGNMRLLYDSDFLSIKNPVTGNPMVVPVPGL